MKSLIGQEHSIALQCADLSAAAAGGLQLLIQRKLPLCSHRNFQSCLHEDCTEFTSFDEVLGRYSRYMNK